jgi:hypothetical protein
MPTNDFNGLAQLDHAIRRIIAPQGSEGISEGAGTDEGARVKDSVATNFGTVAQDDPELPQPRRVGSVIQANDNFVPRDFQVGDDDTRTEMGMEA